MNCSRFEESIWLYDELTPSQRKDMDEHSINCKTCRKLAEGFFQSRALLKKVSTQKPAVQNAPHLTQRIMNAIEKEKRMTWLDELVSCLDSYFLRYAFSAVSLFLISFFVFEQAAEYTPPMVSINTLAIKQGPVLDMNTISNTYLTWRENKESRRSISGYAFYKSE
jgi:predicted anti-sigma-YlaC factor YlaD